MSALKRFWGWAKRNDYSILSLILFAMIPVVVVYFFSTTNISDTLLGVIIALLFPIFGNYVNHLLDLQRDRAEAERQKLEQVHANELEYRRELKDAYEHAIRSLAVANAVLSGTFTAGGYSVSDRLEAYEESQNALSTLSLHLPPDDEGDQSHSRRFTDAVEDFNQEFDAFMDANDPSVNVWRLIRVVRNLSQADPRLIVASKQPVTESEIS